MKLNATLIERTLSQYDAQAIPDNHPVVPQLESLFGEHTFFVDGAGLHIVEPTTEQENGAQTAQVVRIANWKDAERTSLVPQDPEPTDTLVVFSSDGADGKDGAA